MTEKKKKQIFEEDLTVFQGNSLQGNEASSSPVKKSPGRRKVNNDSKELEKLIKNLQALGFKITPPSTEEELKKQEVSLEKLGFKDSRKKVPKEESHESLKGVLGTRHFIAGQCYGPGPFELPFSEKDLYRTLLQQDQLSKQAHYDSSEYNPTSRCFMIKPGNGQDRYNKYRKQEVSQGAFNSESTWEEATITAGKFDVAGFNPSFFPQGGSF